MVWALEAGGGTAVPPCVVLGTGTSRPVTGSAAAPAEEMRNIISSSASTALSWERVDLDWILERNCSL